MWKLAECINIQFPMVKDVDIYVTSSHKYSAQQGHILYTQKHFFTAFFSINQSLDLYGYLRLKRLFFPTYYVLKNYTSL